MPLSSHYHITATFCSALNVQWSDDVSCMSLLHNYTYISISLPSHYHLISISQLHSVQCWMYSDQTMSAVCLHCIITHTLASHYHITTTFCSALNYHLIIISLLFLHTLMDYQV